MNDKKRELKIRSVRYNFIMNAILKMSSFLFPLITFPYVSRILGPDGNGKVSFATSVIYYFTTFAALGIPTYGIRVCAQCRNDKEKLSKTVHELLMTSTILTVFSYIVLVIMIKYVPKLHENAVVLLITSLSLVLSNIGVEWFYQAIEQYDYITVRNIGFKIVSIVMMFLFVKNSQDYIVYAGIQVVGTVGSNILNLVRLNNYIFIKKYHKYNFLQHLKPALSFFMMTIATTIYTNLDTVMLGFISGDKEVGYYNAAVKMKNILVSIVAALGTVLLPRASYYIKENMHKEYKRLIEKSFKVVCIIAIPLMLFCMLEAKNILLFLAGEAYIMAVPTMIVIMPTILFIGLSNITGMQILIPLSKEKYTIISTIVGAVIDLFLNAILIPQYGALGAAIGTLIAELAVLVVQLIFLKKSPYIQQEYGDFRKILISAVIAFLVVVVCNDIFIIYNLFGTLVTFSTLFFGVYGIFLILFKEEIIMEYAVKYILAKIRGKKGIYK